MSAASCCSNLQSISPVTIYILSFCHSFAYRRTDIHRDQVGENFSAVSLLHSATVDARKVSSTASGAIWCPAGTLHYLYCFLWTACSYTDCHSAIHCTVQLTYIRPAATYISRHKYSGSIYAQLENIFLLSTLRHLLPESIVDIQRT